MSGADVLEQLRARVLAGDGDALRVLNDGVLDLGPLATRYLRGDCEAVWEALVALGPEVRSADVWPQAWAIAWETMRRVRVNLTTLCERLRGLGYQFAGDTPLGQPASAEALSELSRRARGPLPLSFHAFWAVVGSVDLRQSTKQSVHDWLEEGGSELALLGDDDPLMVLSVDEILRSPRLLHEIPERGLYTFFAPDVFHKAGVSGGENYHLWLPSPHADVRIVGDVCPTSESAPDFEDGGQYFMRAVRRSMQGGGFRGRFALDDDGDAMGWQPWRAIHGQLGAGLLSV